MLGDLFVKYKTIDEVTGLMYINVDVERVIKLKTYNVKIESNCLPERWRPKVPFVSSHNWVTYCAPNYSYELAGYRANKCSSLRDLSQYLTTNVYPGSYHSIASHQYLVQCTRAADLKWCSGSKLK